MRSIPGLGLLLLAGGSTLPAQTPAGLIPRSSSHPAAPAPATPVAPSSATLPAGTPLRVQLDHRMRMRMGQTIAGRLIAPVYAGDRVVLPIGAPVAGVISGLRPLDSSTRIWARLDGDVTPLQQPVIDFTAIELPGRTLPLAARASERTAPLVTMSASTRPPSLLGRLKAQIAAKEQSAKGTFTQPHKTDALLKFIYGQLPYHPQDIWAGTQYDAVLTHSLAIPLRSPRPPLPQAPPRGGHIPPGILDARLTTRLTSATDHRGAPVTAVLTAPYFNRNRTAVILPTGTRLTGIVTEARPARMFARNGILRFTFQHIDLPGGGTEKVHGVMTAVEGAKSQNIGVDSEGGARANSGQGKFLAPVLLGAFAVKSTDSDQGAAESGAYGNGFGIVARIVTFTAVTPAVSAGFAYFAMAKSMTRRWILPGNNVTFARNTRLELAIADR